MTTQTSEVSETLSPANGAVTYSPSPGVDLADERVQSLLTCGKLFNEVEHQLHLLYLTASPREMRLDDSVPWQSLRRTARKLARSGPEEEYIDKSVRRIRDWWSAVDETEDRIESVWMANEHATAKWVALCGRPAENPTSDAFVEIVKGETEEIWLDVACMISVLEQDLYELMSAGESKLFELGKVIDQLERPLPVAERLASNVPTANEIKILSTRHKRPVTNFVAPWLLPMGEPRKMDTDEQQAIVGEIQFRCGELQIDPFDAANIGGDVIGDNDEHFLGLTVKDSYIAREGFKGNVRVKGDSCLELIKFFISKPWKVIKMDDLQGHWDSIGSALDPEVGSVRGLISRANKYLRLLGVQITNQGRKAGWRLEPIESVPTAVAEKGTSS